MVKNNEKIYWSPSPQLNHLIDYAIPAPKPQYILYEAYI